MIVKPADPDALIRDPITKTPLARDGGEVQDSNFWIRRTIPSGGHDAEVCVLVGDQWHRAMRDGTTEKTAANMRASEPTGLEPIAPLTTRKGR